MVNVLIVFCAICFVQVLCGSATSEDQKQAFRKNVKGVSDRFVDDFLFIDQTFEDVELIGQTLKTLSDAFTKEIIKNEKTLKVDVDGINKFKSDNLEESIDDGEIAEDSAVIDYIKVVRLILSKQVPQHRYNGITNLLYATAVHNTTTEEIESALDYLYSPGNNELKDLAADLPTPNATDCPQTSDKYSPVNDKLKSFTGIKPEVSTKFAIISKTFPCFADLGVLEFQEYFLYIVYKLKLLVSTNELKISACDVKKQSDISDGLNCSLLPDGKANCHFTLIKEVERRLKNVETILSTRLEDEVFRELIDFVRATLIDKTPQNDIQKSLENVFIDAVATDCSTA